MTTNIQKCYKEAESPERFMSLHQAQLIWLHRAPGPKDSWPLNFSAGKGGRVWVNDFFTFDDLAALLVVGREAVPEDEVGNQWWRMPEEYYTDTAFEWAGPVNEPMTIEQAKKILEAKCNGSYSKPIPDRPNTLIELDGETQLEEIEAIIVIWDYQIKNKTILE